MICLLPIGPRLLGAKRDDGERRVRQPGRRLDRRDDAERAVEPAGGRDAVEVRARPDARRAARAEEVARLVARDLEARLAHPAGGELVRRVLLGRVRRRDAARSRRSRRDARAPLIRAMLAAPASRRAGTAQRPRSRRATTWRRRARRRDPGRSSTGRLRIVCCRPIADAAAAAARELERGREREAVPAHRERAGDDQHRNQHRQRRVEKHRRDDDETARRRARSRAAARACSRERPTSGRR